jgi:hypothetical protein
LHFVLALFVCRMRNGAHQTECREIPSYQTTGAAASPSRSRTGLRVSAQSRGRPRREGTTRTPAAARRGRRVGLCGERRPPAPALGPSADCGLRPAATRRSTGRAVSNKGEPLKNLLYFVHAESHVRLLRFYIGNPSSSMHNPAIDMELDGSPPPLSPAPPPMLLPLPNF